MLQGSQHVGKGVHTSSLVNADKNVCTPPKRINTLVRILTVY